jgi:hypothetical protein
MLLLLLGCSLSDRVRAPQDTALGFGADVSIAQSCPEGFFDGNLSTTVVRDFEVDGVPAAGVVEKLCIMENGLTVRAELVVQGELAIVEMVTRNAGYIYLPTSALQLTISYAGQTWHETDTLEGLVILMPIDERSDRFEGDIDFRAMNYSEVELYFGMTWTGRP